MPNRPTENVALFNADTSTIAKSIWEAARDPNTITDRQFEAFFYVIVAGMSSAQMSDYLGISHQAGNNLFRRAYNHVQRRVRNMAPYKEVNFYEGYGGRKRNDLPEEEAWEDELDW